MILDTGTLIGIIIALVGASSLILILMRENLYLKRTVEYLLEKEDNNG